MADPRYKNGQFKGNGYKRKNKNALVDNHPLTWGWQKGDFNERYQLRVYTMGPFKLMKHPNEDGWILECGHKQWHINWPIEEITDFVKDAI